AATAPPVDPAPASGPGRAAPRTPRRGRGRARRRADRARLVLLDHLDDAPPIHPLHDDALDLDPDEHEHVLDDHDVQHDEADDDPPDDHARHNHPADDAAVHDHDHADAAHHVHHRHSRVDDDLDHDPVGSRAVLSVVVPVRNEERSIALLYDELAAALDPLGEPWEAVFVDDGSTDGSFAALTRLHAAAANLRVVRLRRNFGKAAALVAGFDQASGETIVTIDGDLQDDPSEIP